MTQPSFKRPQPSSFGQNNYGSHGNFGGGGHKDASNSKGPCGQSKYAKADSKGPSKSTSFNKNMKRAKSGSDKNYDFWNRAKKGMYADEFNRRLDNNACINCGEVGHRFHDCPKPKPWLLESVLDCVVPTY